MPLNTQIHFWKLSWKEIEKLDRDRTLIIIPTGAIEQHGPHLPIDTDIFNSTTISEEVARTFSPGETSVLLAPPIWWGTSPHHLGFPGTLSLRAETLSNVLVDLLSSLLPHGFYRFLILNGHGGNIGILTATVSRIKEELGVSVPMLSYWTMITETLIKVGESELGGMGHACEMETSLMLHLRPELVQMDQAVKEIPKLLTTFSSTDFRSGGPVGIPLDFKRDSKHGVMGDPTVASAEKGARFFKDATNSVASLITELLALDKSVLQGEFTH
jgi:creatinine amidohydrolase